MVGVFTHLPTAYGIIIKLLLVFQLRGFHHCHMNIFLFLAKQHPFLALHVVLLFSQIRLQQDQWDYC